MRKKIILCSDHFFQLSVSTIIAICHCCRYIPICKEFRRREEAEGEVLADFYAKARRA